MCLDIVVFYFCFISCFASTACVVLLALHSCNKVTVEVFFRLNSKCFFQNIVQSVFDDVVPKTHVQKWYTFHPSDFII